MKILHLLVSRPGEVVTRDELLNQCWGMEYFPESRTLDQHVLNLRKKLEEDPSNPRWIVTSYRPYALVETWQEELAEVPVIAHLPVTVSARLEFLVAT